jgi:hypothetical protein
MASPIDLTKFVHPSQLGGIERYVIEDGAARGVRALCFNSGGGLRFRVLPDRGLDIDQAFFDRHSLAFLSHKGVSAPTRGLDRGADWLKSFMGGLLTSCGPFNIGAPVNDNGEDLGLHGPHSNTPAEIESVIQPDPRAGRLDMSVTAAVRYGSFYGPLLNLRRTIACTLGSNQIRFTDEFVNPGNTAVPHAWLLHINLGYPLVDQGAILCYDVTRIEPMPGAAMSAKTFAPGNDAKRIPAPLESHRGETSAVGYLYPRADRDGAASVGIINDRLGIGLAIRYDTRQFPRCANWQHFGPHEYVTALEPANGSVEGRDKDRAAGVLDSIPAGQSRRYDYSIEVLTPGQPLEALRRLNG